MGATASSLQGTVWHPPATTTATTAQSPPPHSSPLATLLLVHNSCTVLVRLPSSYTDALAAARKTFALPEDADVRLEVKWGDGEEMDVELTEEVWGVVQPGSRVVVKLPREEQARKGVLKRAVQPEDGENGEAKRVRWEDGGQEEQGPSLEKVDKGKGKAVDQDSAGADDDEKEREELAALDRKTALLLQLINQRGGSVATSKAGAGSSSSSSDFVCPHGNPLSSFAACSGGDDDDDDDEEADFGFLTFKEHSGGVIARMPYDRYSEQKIQQAYDLIDRKTDDRDYGLVFDGMFLERERGWKRLGYYSVPEGAELKVVRGNQVVVDAFINTRREHLYLEAIATTKLSDVLSILAFTLSIPLSDLYISNAGYRSESRTLLSPTTSAATVWIMSEAWAKKEQEEREKIGGEPGGSGLSKEEKKEGEGEKEVEKVTVEEATAAEEAKEAPPVSMVGAEESA
ncbi:hypothetical protein JCM6882_005038 [Rhodosporidiobolus microsporus]